MQLFVRNGIEYLIDGAYALRHYTGLDRDTKDFDLMIRPESSDIVRFHFSLKRHLVPPDVMDELDARLMKEVSESPAADPLCNGTLLSRLQYLADITTGGVIDGRTTGRSKIKPDEIQVWTKASLK
jgi:hypothetical protein